MESSESDHGEHGVTVTSTASVILESQPSCLEFAKTHDLLVVGTYNLADQAESNQSNDECNSAIQKRTGSLLVFRITQQTATLLQTKVLPYAILDLHFSPQDPSIFGIATSVGTVCIFTIDCACNGLLQLVRSIRVCEPSILVLSLAFQVPGHSTADMSSLLAVSLSNGHVAVLDSGKTEQSIATVPTHSEEAWTVVWSKPPANHESEETMAPLYLYSGGDDSLLAKHRANLLLSARESSSEYGSSSQDMKTHGAGVTAILPIADQEDDLVVTGSYDEYVRILIPPKHGRGRAKVLAEKRLGGGVWRLSRQFGIDTPGASNTIRFNVLASCMHAGARVLQIDKTSGVWTINIIARFTEHESMDYASDVRISKEDTILVSTSFYDRRLCVWNLRDIR